jgi:hypothetical protein
MLNLRNFLKNYIYYVSIELLSRFTDRNYETKYELY